MAKPMEFCQEMAGNRLNYGPNAPSDFNKRLLLLLLLLLAIF
jgi:hypothetical protein